MHALQRLITLCHNSSDLRDGFKLLHGSYVQEFCAGGALRALIQQGALSARQLPHRFHPILSLLKGIAQGMQYITDRGICHGDLNPSNILLHVCALLTLSPHPTDHSSDVQSNVFL
jgi:serine/threonine protein kinase